MTAPTPNLATIDTTHPGNGLRPAVVPSRPGNMTVVDGTLASRFEGWRAVPRTEQLIGLGPRVWVTLEVCPADAARRMAAGEIVPAPMTVLALVDTGSEVTAVHQRVIREMGVAPIIPPEGSHRHRLLLWNPWHGATPSGLYPFLLRLHGVPGGWDWSNEGLFSYDDLEGAPPAHAALEEHRVVLGRDVLRHCIFAYSGPEGRCALGVLDPPQEE